MALELCSMYKRRFNETECQKQQQQIFQLYVKFRWSNNIWQHCWRSSETENFKNSISYCTLEWSTNDEILKDQFFVFGNSRRKSNFQTPSFGVFSPTWVPPNDHDHSSWIIHSVLICMKYLIFQMRIIYLFINIWIPSSLGQLWGDTLHNVTHKINIFNL